MRSKVGIWGGSAAIRLPKAVVERLGVREGEDLDLSLENATLIVRPLAPRYTLAQLLHEADTLTPPEVLDDEPVGSEWQ